MPIVRATPHEGKPCGVFLYAFTKHNNPEHVSISDLPMEGEREEKRDKKIFSTTLRSTNKIAAPGMGMLVFLVCWVRGG